MKAENGRLSMLPNKLRPIMPNLGFFTDRSMLTSVVVVFLMIVIPHVIFGETLRGVIAKSERPLNAKPSANLDLTLLRHAVLDSNRWFVVAYYLQGNTPASEQLLFVDRYDRDKETWIGARFLPEQRRAGDADCLGLGITFHNAEDGFLLGTHLSPSAECLLVLSEDLQVRAVLYGWPLATFRDGTIVYHRSQIHFASAHALEIGIFDRSTGRDYTLFPRKPFQAIRLAEIAKLRDFFKSHEEWCNLHNHPCNPEWFDNALDGNVVVNQEQGAVAFVVDYGSDPQDHSSPPVSVGHRKAVYVYRHVRNEASMEYREMLQQDVSSKFGTTSLDELLTPGRLRQIFGN
jgi:hypothetical protein